MVIKGKKVSIKRLVLVSYSLPLSLFTAGLAPAPLPSTICTACTMKHYRYLFSLDIYEGTVPIDGKTFSFDNCPRALRNFPETNSPRIPRRKREIIYYDTAQAQKPVKTLCSRMVSYGLYKTFHKNRELIYVLLV